jgi:hypothetical protein
MNPAVKRRGTAGRKCHRTKVETPSPFGRSGNPIAAAHCLLITLRGATKLHERHADVRVTGQRLWLVFDRLQRGAARPMIILQ